MWYFKAVTVNDKDNITSYLKKYGESSCQHSLPLMTGLFEKYGDEYVIEDETLYIHRKNRDKEGFRVYLAPLGPLSHGADYYVDKVLDDAHAHGCRAIFETVTDSFINSINTNRFTINESRDYAEYIYLRDTLAILPGRALAPKRNRVRAFYSAYEGHIRIEDISEKNIIDVMEFQEEWINDRRSEGFDETLERENIAIKHYLSNYNALDFRGIAVYVYGKLVGYAAGAPISETTMDEIIEKGRKDITGIYQLLCNEFAIICCNEYKYINREEDIGLEGLRRAKLSYMPEILLNKSVLTEKE